MLLAFGMLRDEPATLAPGPHGRGGFDRNGHGVCRIMVAVTMRMSSRRRPISLIRRSIINRTSASVMGFRREMGGMRAGGVATSRACHRLLTAGREGQHRLFEFVDKKPVASFPATVFVVHQAGKPPLLRLRRKKLKPNKPPQAATSPGTPAPTIGPGTETVPPPTLPVQLSPVQPANRISAA
jgi:hypothetical protein